MAHASGITVSEALLQQFAAAVKDDSKRWLKIKIVDESLVLEGQADKVGDDAQDMNAMSEGLSLEPSYIIFKLSDQTPPAEWMLMMYVPSCSSVRDRMVYASTRDAVKRDLGYNFFCGEMFGSAREELNWQSYKDSKSMETVANPLSYAELQKMEELKLEVDTSANQSNSQVKFPMSDDAKARLAELQAGGLNYVELAMEATKETIELVSASTVDVGALSGQAKGTEPRFLFYALTHNSERHTVFVYSCPDSAPVRLKMLYSTCKSTCEKLAQEVGVKITKKLEIRQASELEERLLMEELFPAEKPQQSPTASAFSRPSRPGRGKARVVKAEGAADE